MEKNEIKKVLYKQKPKAVLVSKTNEIFKYETEVTVEDVQETIKFSVPVSDMGDASFEKEMEGQLLIRWIV